MRAAEFVTESRDSQGVAESFDKTKVNELIQQIRSGKAIANLSTDDQQILMSVIDDAKQKLMSMLNSDSKLRIDWPQVKQYIDKYQSQILMTSWDIWFKVPMIKQDLKQNKIYLEKYYNDDRLVVYPAMYNFLQWRFLITFLTHKINRNIFMKSDVDTLLKLKTLLDTNQTVSEQGVSENFADGKVKGKSRPGRVKRAGASCAGSVTDLRAKAKKYGGERGKMYHWCANMKAGKKK